MGRFSYLWEYGVPAEAEAEFLAHYAPGGTWARLFRRAPGYMGTELYRDRGLEGRYLTVDHWRHEADFREFRRVFATEFEALSLVQTVGGRAEYAACRWAVVTVRRRTEHPVDAAPGELAYTFRRGDSGQGWSSTEGLE